MSGGDLYIADAGNCRIRKLSAGQLSTVAGNGTCGFSGDGPATANSLNHPTDVVFDLSGNVYIADQDNCRVREVVGPTMTTIAGNGSCGYSGEGTATSVAFNQPSGLALDATGALLLSDSGNCRVRRLSGGVTSTIVGSGACGPADNADGGPATSAVLYLRGYHTFINGLVYKPSLIATSGTDLYVSDGGCRLRKVSGGVITSPIGATGHCRWVGGDGGPPTAAGFAGPTGVATDAAGAVLIADYGACVVRRVASNTIATVAGNGVCGYGGDSGSPTSAMLNNPRSVAVDANANLYIADTVNCRVRKVSGGSISTLAGNGTCGYNGDGIAASAAQLNSPAGLAVGPTGDVYIADTSNCRVRRVAAGMITTIAGTGACVSSADGGPATSTGLNYPAGVALDTAGNVYIADTANCRIRMVRGGGLISTVAGSGIGAPNFCSYSGNDVPAKSAQLQNPAGVAVDEMGNVYIADDYNCIVREVSAGVIRTVAGHDVGAPSPGLCVGLSGDGGPATSADIANPKGVALTRPGTSMSRTPTIGAYEK